MVVAKERAKNSTLFIYQESIPALLARGGANLSLTCCLWRSKGQPSKPSKEQVQGSTKRSGEGGGQWKIFQGSQAVHKAEELEKGAGGLGGGGECLRARTAGTCWDRVIRRPDRLAFGQTRWWIFIFKRILNPRNQEPLRVVGPLIPLVEDKSVLFKNVKPPVIEFLLSKLWHRLSSWEIPRNL